MVFGSYNARNGGLVRVLALDFGLRRWEAGGDGNLDMKHINFVVNS